MKNDKKVKDTTDSRTYRLLTTIDQDLYFDDNWSIHKGWGTKISPARKWKRKVLYKFQYRMFRTWKYNRKTQWK